MTVQLSGRSSPLQDTAVGQTSTRPVKGLAAYRAPLALLQVIDRGIAGELDGLDYGRGGEDLPFLMSMVPQAAAGWLIQTGWSRSC